MKKLFQVVMMAAIVFGAVLSCSKENPQPENPANNGVENSEPGAGEDEYVTLTFIAEFEGQDGPAAAPAAPGTKMSAMDDSGNFTWADGDEVKVLYAGGSTTANAVVTDNKATFSPTIKAGTEEVWLVYPSSASVTLDGGNLIVPMPDVQKNSLNGLFVAKALASDTKAAFCHPVCYYKIDVNGDGSDVTRMVLTSASANLTATSLTVDFDANQRPTVSSVTGGASTITYDFDGVGSYYIPIVPGTAELAADDLTFQFYRSDTKDEKAGGYVYSKALTNARAAIINWAGLPEKATNRYLEESPAGSKTGSKINPWSYDELKTFLTTQASELVDGIKIHAAAGTYAFRNVNIKLKAGIRISLLGEGTDKTFFDGGSVDCLLGQNVDGTPAEQTLVFKDICFQNAHRQNENGGVFYIKFGHFIFDNCVFTGNQAKTDNYCGGVGNIYQTAVVDFKDCVFQSNSAAKDGGVLQVQGSTKVNISGCTFQGNSASLEGGVIKQLGGTINVEQSEFLNNSSNNNASDWVGGGVIYVTGSSAVANFSNCTFTGNRATRSGACARVHSSGTLKAANCVFSGNTSKRGGVFVVHGQGKCFLHNVRLLDNSTSDNWGMVLQESDNASWVCANNLVVEGNHKSDNSDNGVSFNCNNSSVLLVNSTLINKGNNGVIRFSDGDNGTGYVLNSIILNTLSGKDAFTLTSGKTTTVTSGGYSIIGSVSGTSGTATFTAAGSDKTGIAYNSSDWTWDPTNLYFTWSGSFDSTNYANDGIVPSTIQGLVSAQNADFASWVVSIDPDGFTKDIRSTARGAHAWPGSYDN